LGIQEDKSSTTEHKKHLKKAKLEIVEIQNNAKEIRVEFLQDLATKYALDNNIPYEKAIRELLVHEELREIFGEIKLGLNLIKRSQTYRIWLPKSEGVTDTPPEDWKTTKTEQVEITDGDEIHKKILERNKIHLHQAKDTPFASSKLGNLFKFDGSGSLTEELLTGKTDDMGLEMVCKQYLEGLTVKKIKTLEKVDVEISIEDYKIFWTKKRESTATSPFGLHIGHYKIACDDDEVLEIHRRLLILPFM